MIRFREGSAGARAAAEAGDCVLIVDALRASATLAALAARNAEEILVGGSLEAVEAARSQVEEPIIVGEWHNSVPDWFDFDNSPTTILNYDFSGRSVVFLSTNGARMLLAARGAPLALAASVVNATAVVRACLNAQTAQLDISLVAAGDREKPADEDDASTAVLATSLGPEIAPEQEVQLHIWLARIASDSLETLFLDSEHGQELQRRGKENDVRFCSRADQLSSLAMVEEYTSIGEHEICRLTCASSANLSID